MKNAPWSAIYELFQDVDALLSRAERFDGEKRAQGGAAPAAGPADAASPQKKAAGKAAFFKAYVPTDDLVEVRSKLRGKLDLLKASLAQHLTERETFLVLFPLVVLLDELVQNRFVAGGQGGSWPPLQAELFKIDNGGEAFYDTLDDLLRKPDTLPFVYEIFYLSLGNGFKGRHAENPAKIAEYRHKLEGKIPVEKVARKNADEVRTVSRFATFPAWRYGASAALLVGVYVALRFVAGYLGL